MKQHIGPRIVELRKARGWTQPKLARAARVHKNTILHAEKTGAIQSSTLERLARALGVTLNDLYLAPKRPERGV